MLVISACSLDTMIYSYLPEFRSGHLQNSFLTAFGMLGGDRDGGPMTNVETTGCFYRKFTVTVIGICKKQTENIRVSDQTCWNLNAIDRCFCFIPKLTNCSLIRVRNKIGSSPPYKNA